MRYAYNDLGQQQAGATVSVRLSGSASNVVLVDQSNFARYRAGQPFLYTGGHYMRTPVRLEIPEDGHWYVIVDLGGYRGRVRAHVEVQSPDGSPAGVSPRSLVVA
jgi:hypothetical protein